MSNAFSAAKVKLTIASKDEQSLRVEAHYNPKELQVDQTVPWKKPDSANQTGGGESGGGGGSKQPMTLEFTGAEGRTMTVEFLFDGYEKNGGDVGAKVAMLQRLASVRDPESADENMRRPHQCLVTWGGTLPNFECVIESLSTKYTMFSSEGTPLRATCTVKLKEAQAVGKKKE